MALIAAQSIFILIGAALVLMRPSMTTWAFFAYAVSVGGGSVLLEAWLPTTAATLTLAALYSIAAAAGPIAFVEFALRFPRDQTMRLGRSLERALTPIFVIYAATSVYGTIAPTLWGRPTSAITPYAVALQVACYAAGVVAFAATYLASQRDDRARIRWVMLGFGLAFAGELGNLIFFQSSLISWSYPIWVLNAFQLPIVFAPIAVAYAVIRHRVIDVRFVVSRALVYAVLTSALVAVFALIDWLIGQVLAQSRLALIAEIGGAIVAGFSLEGLHKSVDRTIDRVLFRQRYLAEQRLSRVTAGLPHARSEKMVGEMLVDEVAHAFDLASASIFRRSEDGAFERQANVGWSEMNVETLDVDDPIILQLHGDSAPLRLPEGLWRRTDLPSDGGRPILAVAVTMRQSLAAVAFYSAHRSGEDLDPDETASIVALAVAAGAAYDHIDAESYRRQNAELSRENEALRRQLATT